MKTNLKLPKVSHPALILTLVMRKEIDKNHLPKHGLIIKILRIVRANARA